MCRMLCSASPAKDMVIGSDVLEYGLFTLSDARACAKSCTSGSSRPGWPSRYTAGALSACTPNGVVTPAWVASSPVRLTLIWPMVSYVHGTLSPSQSGGDGGPPTK